MCELLGLSANIPADIRFTFSGLRQRGGNTGIHKDGWGISLYEGRGIRSFHDPEPSFASEVAHFFHTSAIKSKLIISHIRQANRGRVCLENTHPFSRELWGCDWVFAHNGQLKHIKKKNLQFYNPRGTTDSEYAFCYMLDRIREQYPSRPKKDKELWTFIEQLAKEINQFGVFNFLLSDSRYMYAYCSNKMCWVTRKYPFGEARLIDTGEIVDFSSHLSRNDVITLVASQALTENETWNCMEKGEFKVFNNGKSRKLAA
jgi:predicted glutamine amidotransferase